MWRKEEVRLIKKKKKGGDKTVLRSWWEGLNFSGSSSFILFEKLKALKLVLRCWNTEVFGKVEVSEGASFELGGFLG